MLFGASGLFSGGLRILFYLTFSEGFHIGVVIEGNVIGLGLAREILQKRLQRLIWFRVILCGLQVVHGDRKKRFRNRRT